MSIRGGVAFSTRYPKTLWQMKLSDTEQVWHQVEMGSQSAFPTVTGAIFETGSSDALLQMWAAFLAERAGRLNEHFGCAAPQEALDSHRIFAAATRSHVTRRAVSPAEFSTAYRPRTGTGRTPLGMRHNIARPTTSIHNLVGR